MIELGLPSNVGAHEDNADTHDGEQGLEGDVVLDTLDGGALHGGRVVQLPASLTHQVRVISCAEKLG